MLSQLAQLFGFPVRQPRSQPDSTELNEVSEHEGILLVRLGRGSAMQVRVQCDGAGAAFRIVPIAEAKQVSGEVPWLVASDTQLEAWIQPDSTIGRWLIANGLRPEEPAISHSVFSFSLP
jgi:hypothetical protein